MTDPHHTVPAEVEHHIQEAAGHIYQAIAQTMAMKIEDAADALRNISEISATALAVAMEQILERPHVSETEIKAAIVWDMVLLAVIKRIV